MSPHRYSVTPHPIETILTWVKSGEIAIPEIQRPFVWDATKVRDLLDSLYAGYPVGYLIVWQNPAVKLKDGTHAAGKRILIDGQQRVTALMAALLGRDVLTKDYETTRIRIAFHPQEQRFEVANPAIGKDAAWIHDVSTIFSPTVNLWSVIDDYVKQNPPATHSDILNVLERLRKMVNNPVGVIDLAADLDIDTVTEIFIRVNSAGVTLSQADFAMSKIAVNESYGGNVLRKAIDYFCHMAVSPEFGTQIEQRDPAFAASEFYPKMKWLKDANSDIYDPSYTDMLRVAFTSEFKRGRLQDLVALLSGRNFETKQFEDIVAEESFGKLKRGILSFMNQKSFEGLIMILQSAGFVTSSLVGGRNTINFAYIMYLKGKEAGLKIAEVERLVRRWYAMSVLRGRYASGPETTFDFDIRQIETHGLVSFAENMLATELPASFWAQMLPQLMETSSATSPYFHAFKAAQVKLGDKGFLSRDISVRSLLEHQSDVHHIFPRNHLKAMGLSRGSYNQIANLTVTQSEVNIAIGGKSPEKYFSELAAQCSGGTVKYGGITDLDEMRANFRMSCVPETMLDGVIPTYETFLAERRKLMAERIRTWFEAL